MLVEVARGWGYMSDTPDFAQTSQIMIVGKWAVPQKQVEHK